MADKTAAQKLLIKDGQKIGFVHPPQNVGELLGSLPPGAHVVDTPAEPLDFILLFADSRQALEADLASLKNRVQPAGNIWVAYHKGTSKIKTDINRDSIYAYALSLGLQTVSMISIDDDWAAMRMKRTA